MTNIVKIRSMQIALVAAIALAFLIVANSFAAAKQVTKPFSGVKVNGGTVTHSKEGKVNILTLSEDFKPPDAPDAHWQVVDSRGRVYLLDRLQLKGDKLAKTIKVPSYVLDIAKVQMWCAFAETLLGEASFDKPVK